MGSRKTEVELLGLSLGQEGGIAKTIGAVTGSFCSVQAVSDCTFTTLTSPISDFAALLNITIPAGTVIYSPFTAITSSVGTYIAYKG